MQQHGVHGLSNKHALHTLHLARGRKQVENRVGHPGVVLEPAVGGACDLPPTENPPLPADADEKLRLIEATFPISVPDWWTGRA